MLHFDYYTVSQKTLCFVIFFVANNNFLRWFMCLINFPFSHRFFITRAHASLFLLLLSFVSRKLRWFRALYCWSEAPQLHTNTHIVNIFHLISSFRWNFILFAHFHREQRALTNLSNFAQFFSLSLRSFFAGSADRKSDKKARVYF